MRTDRRPATTVTIDERGRVTAWGTTVQQILGHRPDEVLGRPVTDLLAAPLPLPAARALARRVPWRGTVEARHKDGRTVRVTCDAHPVHRGGTRWTVRIPAPSTSPDPPGPLMEWAFAQSPMAMALYDGQGRLVRANDTLVRLSGRTEEEMRGRHLTDLLTEPPLDLLAQVCDRALRTGEPQRAESRMRAHGQDAEAVWASFLTPLKDDDGRVRGLSSACLDTTREHRAVRRLALVDRAAVRIGTMLDATRTAQELAEVAHGDFADTVTVDLLEPAPRPADPPALRRAAERPAPGRTAATRPPSVHYAPGSPQARALTTGRSGILGPGVPGATEDDGLHSLLVAPLTARGHVLGLAQFGRRRRTGPFGTAFDADDRRLAEDLASRTAACIDNARRYTRERAIAVTLQQSLLPHRTAPQNAVEVATRYLPTGSRAGVGGDWYDVIPLSGARVALVVGDVVGHGLRASATMGQLRTAVRTLADLDLPPDELLTHLDDLVTGPEQDELTVPGAGGMCATCLYAVYDPITGHCCAASAGHPSPVLVTPDGTADPLDLPHGPPLGVGGLPFEAREFTLAAGSVLALYTDGLVDGPGRDAGRLCRLLARTVRTTDCLEHACDTLLTTFLPDRPDDDVALLLARTRAVTPARTCSWDLPADPAAVTDARALATRRLAAWGLDDLAFTTELVVSELVTNAIRHAAAPVRLRLIHDTRLICEVSDAGATAPRMRRARTFDEGGRGLLLVARLTHRWGTRYTAEGKTIWTEQLLPDGKREEL